MYRRMHVYISIGIARLLTPLWGLAQAPPNYNVLGRPDHLLQKTLSRQLLLIMSSVIYTALVRGDSKLRFTITAMEQEREGEIERLRKRQTTTPHRPAKRSRLLEAKLRSNTVSRPPQMTAQLGHFQLLTPRGNPKRVYVYSFAISRHFLCFFWLVAIRLVACTQL